MKQNADFLLYPAAAAVVFAADQSFKKAVKKKIPADGMVRVKDFVILSNTKNGGFACNAFEKDKKLVRTVTAAATGTVAGVLGTTLALTGSGEKKLRKAGLSLLTGGALGNLMDRLRDGYVTDFVTFTKGPEKLTQLAFNTADFSIFAGAILIVIDEILEKSDD